MDLEQIVKQILLVRRDLSREEILKKIYEKKRSAEGYYIDEVAARIVASELGVDIPSELETLPTEIPIENLVSGLNDVTVIGRVIIVYPVQAFQRPDLTEGKVARFLLADKTGRVRVVLWDDKTGLVETGKIEQGLIVRVLHGYLREGLDGKPELHVGQRGNVQVSPPDAVESTYPPITHFIDKIGQLTAKRKKANVLGVVQDVYGVSEFRRKDGTSGKVRRLQLRDETGRITVVFWNEKVDELGEPKKGQYLRIMNTKIRAQPDGQLELHVEKATQIESLAEQEIILTPEAEKNKISNIRAEGGPFTIEATVASQPNTREVTISKNEKVLVTSFDIADETGKIRINLWRNQAELSKDFTLGTKIKLTNIYAKRGFSNLLELVSRKSTTIETV